MSMHTRTRPTPEQRAKNLGSTLAALDKQYGKGTVMRLGDDVDRTIEAISTGSLGLDIALAHSSS